MKYRVHRKRGVVPARMDGEARERADLPSGALLWIFASWVLLLLAMAGLCAYLKFG